MPGACQFAAGSVIQSGVTVTHVPPLSWTNLLARFELCFSAGANEYGVPTKGLATDVSPCNAAVTESRLISPWMLLTAWMKYVARRYPPCANEFSSTRAAVMVCFQSASEGTD